MKKALFLFVLVLGLDQVSKYLVKTNLYLGEEIPVLGNWFIIHFTENPGMAFGLELGGETGKLLLTLFRILVALFGFWFLNYLQTKKYHPGLILSGALILAGAVGNIIDSVFYGQIFSDSREGLSVLFPPEGGYAPWLHGHVVDMLYFPVIETHYPEWFPVWGGEEFIFFRPVFNIADASISTGVGFIFVFQKRFFPTPEKLQDADPLTEPETPNPPAA